MDTLGSDSNRNLRQGTSFSISTIGETTVFNTISQIPKPTL
jgi:hypothetical protein